MNWDAIGAVSEAVGAIGVIVTLVYLAYQIRQNTNQLRQNELTDQAAAVNAISIALRENRRSLFESSEMMDIWLKGLAGPEQFDETAAYRFRLAMHNVVDAMWDMYSQTMMTGFAPETWATNGIPFVKRIMNTPGEINWRTGKRSIPKAGGALHLIQAN